MEEEGLVVSWEYTGLEEFEFFVGILAVFEAEQNLKREAEFFSFTFRARFKFVGYDFRLLCILDNAMTVDLVAIDFNKEEEEGLVVSWDSITDVVVDSSLELEEKGLAGTMNFESVVEELEEKGLAENTRLVTVDSSIELEDLEKGLSADVESVVVDSSIE